MILYYVGLLWSVSEFILSCLYYSRLYPARSGGESASVNIRRSQTLSNVCHPCACSLVWELSADSQLAKGEPPHPEPDAPSFTEALDEQVRITHPIMLYITLAFIIIFCLSASLQLLLFEVCALGGSSLHWSSSPAGWIWDVGVQ